MSNKQVIKTIVDTFIKDKKPFTSLDISNEVKSNGDWIRNSQVSNELKSLFRSNTYPDYRITEIEVIRKEDQSIVTAILYLPEDNCETEYTNISGNPITPDDFDSKNPSDDNDSLEVDDVIDDNEDTEQNVKDDKPKKSKIKKSAFTKSKRNYSRFNFR